MRKTFSDALGATLLMGLLLASCAPCRESQLVQLYFGRAIPGGGEVDETAWTSFVAAELGPRFPDGFTVLDATGQWRAPETGAITRERTKLVEIAAPAPPRPRAASTRCATPTGRVSPNARSGS
jgi:hypothetical protein